MARYPKIMSAPAETIELRIEADTLAEANGVAGSLTSMLRDLPETSVSRRSSVPGAHSSGDIITVVAPIVTALIPVFKELYLRGNHAKITVTNGDKSVTLENISDVRVYEIALQELNRSGTSVTATEAQ